MARFSKVLLALDLSPESEALIKRVCLLGGVEQDNLHVVHVVRSGLHDTSLLQSTTQPDPYIQRQLDHISLQIRGLLHKHGLMLGSDRIHLLCGEPAHEIKCLAARLHADLVIVGSHSKDDDWLRLPGATTNCVIQGIDSDVMAVKI